MVHPVKRAILFRNLRPFRHLAIRRGAQLQPPIESAPVSGHSFVTIRLYIWAVAKDSPKTLSSGVVAAVATAYLLFVLVLLMLFSS